MKKFIHIFMIMTILALSVVIIVACKKLGAKGIDSSDELTPNESISTEAPKEITNEPTAEATLEPTPTVVATQTSKQTSDNKNSTVFTNFLETQEFEVKESGTYAFSCNPSDGKTSWDIYVLDEKFEDALRYLTTAYTPTLTATKEVTTYKLKKGQFVYCVCSQNALTFEGNKETFKCPLTIEKKN